MKIISNTKKNVKLKRETVKSDKTFHFHEFFKVKKNFKSDAITGKENLRVIFDAFTLCNCAILFK